MSALTLLLLLFSLSAARQWSSDSLPNPQKDTANICRRSKPSAICDPDGYLSESDADTIDGLINFIQAGTNGFHKVPCAERDNSPIGTQLAVAIFDSLPFGIGDKQKRAYQFSKDLHDRWGVGDATCQNGVVIVLAVKDRAIGFSIGRGVNKIFTDSMLTPVMNHMRPMLKDQEYGGAIINAVTDVGNIVSGGKVVDEGNTDWIGGVVIASIFGTIATGSAFAASRKRRRYARCKNILKKVDNDRARASANNYVITSCPICLEDFEEEGKESNTGESAREVQNDSPIIISTRAINNNSRASVVEPVVESNSEHVPLFSEENGVRDSGNSSPNPRDRTSSKESEKGKVMPLPCGHKFHEPCIVTWLHGNREANQQCPICRQPIDGNQSVEPRTNNNAPSGWDVYEAEYAFRMRRTQHFYPDFITWAMINDWDRNRYESQRPMATSSTFVQVNPVVVAAAARASGSGGSSFSFGGGSSAGGGGGGGGW